MKNKPKNITLNCVYHIKFSENTQRNTTYLWVFYKNNITWAAKRSKNSFADLGVLLGYVVESSLTKEDKFNSVSIKLTSLHKVNFKIKRKCEEFSLEYVNSIVY